MRSILSPSALALLFAALLLLSSKTSAAPFIDTACTSFGCFDGLAKMFQQYAASAGLWSPEPEFKLELLHTNDMHSRFEQTNRLSSTCSPWEAENQMCFGGFARVSTVIKQAREAAEKGEGPPVLALNAGDNFQGSIYYTLFKTEMVTKFMNLLKFDALTIGNHEFDDGPLGLEPYLRNIQSPVVAANVDVSGCNLLSGVTLHPSVVLEIGGKKIGIIGYLTRETETGFIAGSCKIEISDEVTAVKKEAERLSDEGIKIIIALGHVGFTVDQQIALEVPEVDLVIGAHSHTFLYNDNEEKIPDPNDHPMGMYPTIVTQPSGKRVPVVQAYAYTKYIGRLSLTFDSYGDISSVSGNPLLLDKNVPEDPVTLEELQVWKEKLTYYTNKIEGVAPVLLDNTDCRYRECNIGNFVADSYIYYRATKSPSRDKSKGWTDAPIALINAGSVRNSIDARTKKDQVSLRDVIEVEPFNNTISLVKLKGDVLLEVLEHSVSQYDPTLADSKGAFLQVSGLQITYNIDNPSGQRVESVSARCSECDVPRYYPLNRDETYSVLINTYMVQGGDGYNMVGKGLITSFDENTQTAIKTYLNDRSPIYADVGLRITIKNSAMTHSPDEKLLSDRH